MLLNILFLTAGFVILIYGADRLVDGGSALAARLNVPNLVIGLTVVAFGTSAPELVVNIISSLKGEAALALGNVLGSNIFNILAILGVTAAIYPIAIQKTTVRIEVPLALFAAILVFIACSNGSRSASGSYTVSRPEGIVFLCFFLIFIVYTLILARRGQGREIAVKAYPLPKTLFFLVIGLAGLIAGGHLLVKGAVGIAESLGISQRIIAITIVSVGTSLPELATSLVAARKKNVDMAVGNVVGSNLFNTFLILGASTAIRPIPVQAENMADILLNLLAALLLFLFIFAGKKRQIERREGVVFLCLYLAYLLFLIFH